MSERREIGKDGGLMGELAAILEELRRREKDIIDEMVECDTKKGRMGLRERWLEVRELRARFSRTMPAHTPGRDDGEVTPRQR